MKPSLRARALAGVTGPTVFVTSWVIAGALRDGYDPVTDAISRLAELGAPNRWIVSTGMVTFGGACLLFAPCLKRPASRSLAVAGVASLGVAAFPCSEGCPGPGTVTDLGHTVSAGIHYVAFALTPFLHERKRRDLILALIASGALLAHGTDLGPNGLLQRIGLTTLDAWLLLTALEVFRRARSTPTMP